LAHRPFLTSLTDHPRVFSYTCMTHNLDPLALIVDRDLDTAYQKQSL